jgi:ankyrin repeat protein
MYKIAVALLFTLTATAAAAQPAAPPTSDKADALSAAARRGDADAVKKLLDEGVDVNTKYRYGVTALTYACDHGHLAVVQVLLDRGADVNVKDSFYGFTPLLIAVSPAQKRKPEHNDIVKLLLSKGAAGKDDALIGAVGDSNVELTKVVLAAGGFKPETLSAALESAKNDKQADIVTLLEQAGAKPFPEVKLDEAQLARYAGTYRNASGNEIAFSVSEGKLVGGPPAQRFTLSASDDKTFRIVGGPVTITFVTQDNKVTGLTLDQGGNKTNYTRVEK